MTTSTSTSTSTTSADATYRTNLEQVRGMITALQVEVERHASGQAADPRNWGFPGDLEHLEEILIDALHAVGAGEDEDE